MYKCTSDFDLRIEPHPISNKDYNSPFVAEIIKTGIEIKPQSPNAWYSKN